MKAIELIHRVTVQTDQKVTKALDVIEFIEEKVTKATKAFWAMGGVLGNKSSKR